MNKLPALLCSLTLILSSLPVLAEVTPQDGYTLEQVLIVSRHGLHAPSANSGSVLEQSTPYLWPQWDTKGGELTLKGGVLETYFGDYLKRWLVQQGLFNNELCPAHGSVHFYANSLQRTLASGQYFSAGAFPGCNIQVFHKEAIGTMDFIFNPIISYGSADFKAKAVASMNEMAGDGGIEGLNRRLQTAYGLVDQLMDYKDSKYCTSEKICSIMATPTVISLNEGKDPAISGPLRLAASITDVFILQYYQGLPAQDVAWGQIQDLQQLAELAAIKDRLIDVLFASPVLAKQVSEPLVQYVSHHFSANNPVKFTMLFGYDSNIASLLATLKIKAYQLPGQIEKTPIGGKVVFQRWKDKQGKMWVKIDYVYQTTEQIRELQPLTLASPPQSVTLEMQDCPVNQAGFCSLSNFEKAMRAVVN